MGLSLRDLAAKTAVTASFLSQVERGQTSPSINTLRNISTALEIPLFALLVEDELANPVVRKGDRRRLSRAADGFRFELLTPDTNRKMEAVFTEIRAGAGDVPLRYHESTEEFIYVIEGSITVQLGMEHYTLAPGDSIYFRGGLLRRIVADSATETCYISVVTPPVL